MVHRCNAAGVVVYADMLINHMAGPTDQLLGTANSSFDYNSESYPSVPYTSTDFNDENCPSVSGNIDNEEDPLQVRYCRDYGLPDLNQYVTNVRTQLRDYFNKLIDIGVAGFRIDSAVNMLPDDLEVWYRFTGISIHDSSSAFTVDIERSQRP